MAKLIYIRKDQTIIFDHGDGTATPFECRSDFEEGFNEAGEPHESLPDGEYICAAEEPGVEQGPAYGTFYIRTGDPRGRDIHGGGSSLPDPYAPYQGWRCTYGCLRMQNHDGEQLSRLIIEAGNSVALTVQEEGPCNG